MTDLYQLPGSQTAPETAARRVLVGGALSGVAYLYLLTQAFAHFLEYHPVLGNPYIPHPEIPIEACRAVAGLLASAAVVLALGRRRRPAALSLLGCGFLVPWCDGGGIYFPTQILVWLVRFRDSSAISNLVQAFGQLAFWGLLAIAGLVLLLSARAASSLNGPDLHGSARFANNGEILDSGLVPESPVMPGSLAGHDGIYLARWNGPLPPKPLRVNQDRNVLLIAPSRSGKGVGVVVPTALSWQGSLVVHDMKGEIFALSAGFRRQELGQTVLVFNPTRPENSARYNPLSEIRPGDFEVRDTQNITDVLIDPQGDRPPDHWKETAHELLTGLVLHVLYAEDNKTLTGCAEFLGRPGVDIRQALTLMRDTPHLAGSPHPVIAQIAQVMLNKADEELSGIVSTAVTCLRLYRDPLIARVTECSDFRLRDLLDHPTPITLYLIVPGSDQERTQPLIRLLVNQMCRRLVDEMTFEDGHQRPPSNRLALLLDEFPTLGRMPSLQRGLGIFAGYGISTLIVAQDLSQLRGAYGPNESITANCDYRVAFTPNMPETAKLLSALCGETTVHHRHVSRRLGGPLGQATSTPNEVRRPLLTVDEVLRLPADRALVFANGRRPILAHRIRFYEDLEFLRRSRIAPPDQSDRMHPTNPWLVMPKPAQLELKSLTSQLPRRLRKSSAW